MILFANPETQSITPSFELREELLTELRKMFNEDQKIRFHIINSENQNPEDVQLMEEVDQQHFDRLKDIIEVYGWPGYQLIGEEGSNDMWLLIQHQDKNLEFQKKCLILLKKAVDKKNASFINYAYLLDRTLKNEGKPQVYGTQWSMMNGKYSLEPIDDFNNLNDRRRHAGLPPIEEYKKMMMEMYKLTESDFE